jgi:hypothetical protein
MPVALLPLELWRLIFHDATRLDMSSWTASPNESRRYCGFPHREKLRGLAGYDRWLQTKLSLILVCKAWHRISIEFLLEDIYIRNATQYLSVTCMHDSSPSERREDSLGEDSSLHRAHLASCVRALEIAIGPWWETLPRERKQDQGLLFFCHNLRMLRAYPLGYAMPGIKIWYPKKMAQRLRHCQITLDNFDSPACPAINLIEGFHLSGVLEVLQLLVWCDFPDVLLSLPRLHTIRLHVGNGGEDVVISRLVTWNLPALHSFSSSFSSNNPPSHAAFFSTHGSMIANLEIRDGSIHLLPIAIASCPMLESLSVKIDFFCQPLPPLHKLRHLGLYVSSGTLPLLQDVFDNVSRVHVGVTSIQLTSITFGVFARQMQDRNLLTNWRRWDEICFQRSIRFEDLGGELIQFAPSGRE